MNIRLQRVENKISLIYDCLSIPVEPNETIEVMRDLVQADLQREAIELFCQQTGAGLTEAQRTIRAIEKGQL